MENNGRVAAALQHPEAAGERHVDDAPDLGSDVIEADPQSGDGLGHAALLTEMGLTGTGSAIQFQGMSSSQRLDGHPLATFSMMSAM